MYFFSRLQIYLSDIGILVHIFIATCAIVVAVVSGDRWILLAFMLGWCSYIVEEHLTHRFIFHLPAPKSQFWFNILYRLHYGHHDQIQNRNLLFTPLWFSLTLGLANLLVISKLMPLPHAVVFVYGGGVCSYLLFEWMHLISHYKDDHRGAFILLVKRKHARHHFIDFNSWFTVSLGGGFIDSLLRANPKEQSKVKNVRTCGLSSDDSRLIAARVIFGWDKNLHNPTERQSV